MSEDRKEEFLKIKSERRRDRIMQIDVHKKDELLEIKRERERDRYAQITLDKKDELLDMKWESCKQKKDDCSMFKAVLTCFICSLDGPNIYISGGGSKTSTTQPALIDPKERKRRRERERYAQMSAEKKEELLRKNRERRKNKKDGSTILTADCRETSNPISTTPGIASVCGQSCTAWNKENVAPGDDTFTAGSGIESFTSSDHRGSGLESDRKRQKGRQWYAKLSDERRAEYLHSLRISRQHKNSGALVENDQEVESNTTHITIGTLDPLNHADIRPDPDNELCDSLIFEPLELHSSDEEKLEAVQDVPDDFDDEEWRLYRGQDVVFESYVVGGPDSVGMQGYDPYDRIYQNLPKKHHVLREAKNCPYCGAKRFQYEGLAFCCRKGKVKIFIPDVPDELRRLYTSLDDDDAKYFRQHIRYFNSHFSFTSLGVTLDRRVSTAAGTGIYTFRAHGQLYHRLDQLVPGGKGPRHLQLYFYDTDETMEHRAKRSPGLDINLIRKIRRILEHNPYVQTFQNVGSAPNLHDYRIELNTDIALDQRRYNAPTASQVAAIWMEGNDPQKCFDRSVIVYGKADKPRYIRAYHGCYDPLAYPLFFPGGETGWQRKMLYEGPDPVDWPNNYDNNDDDNSDEEDGCSESSKHVSAREYYCFKLQIRLGEFNILLHGRRLFQQWVVDIYIKIESMRLDWYSKPENQALIRADLYQGIIDTIAAGEVRASEVGLRIVLPRTFPGGDRDVQARFLDAMVLVTRFGKPDYFVTMTCNPHWEEITRQLLPGQTPQDRPELVARVYRAKLRDLHDFLIKKSHLGEVASYAHVTEFQKRGLPHEHFLLIMAPNSKLSSPDDYDKVISAEIPDPVKYPVLHALQGKDSYPIYRRREDGRRVATRGAVLDNRWVVPYNPTLLMRYNCHINVEVCSSIKAVKYLYKYVYKGHDRASFSVDPPDQNGTVINEIRQYRDARFITPPEAVYRIFGFPLYAVSPSVLQLQLHLPNMQLVSYRATDNLNDVVNREKSKRSMLTEYFKMNLVDSKARKLLYKEFPEHFRWIKSDKRWQARVKRPQVGRIVYANPAEGERYYLRVLLNHVRGTTSYENLRTVHGKTCSTFREACEMIGLVETDRSLDECLAESTTFHMPCALRRLFATIIVFCEATNIRGLWENHFEAMSQDYRRTHNDAAMVEQLVLRDIRNVVHSMGKDVRNYGLPEVDDSGDVLA
ncbi:uncharacterized protein LOC133910581 [Phragmites australis]|uniref:uncharacterized protein LOC133910581 n=1 Tax=Phragmites australis TaxID=29695 RepID=UPI002D76983E|nr:uncharacterized protein LOC133910581 [Phragmites australis]